MPPTTYRCTDPNSLNQNSLALLPAVGIATYANMKALILLLALLLGVHTDAGAAQAEARLHCLSVRFPLVSAVSSGLNYTLALSTLFAMDGEASNGELAPLPKTAATTHGTFFRLTGDLLVEPLFGSVFLDVPLSADANTNGVPDFFEVSQEVKSTATRGSFESIIAPGKVTLTWSRRAGAKTGNCQIVLEELNLTFTNTFDLAEYSGTLNYQNTLSSSNFSGGIRLEKVAETSKILSGLLGFRKDGIDRIALPAGFLTNDLGQAVAFESIDEVTRRGTNYVAQFQFADGDLTTKAEDYTSWIMRIGDPNDSNRDGVPDLSDAGTARPPLAPALSLRLANGSLLLSISGEIGKLHQVETMSVLGGSAWTLATSVVLSSDPQTVPLPLPTNASRTAFWRVKIP